MGGKPHKNSINDIQCSICFLEIHLWPLGFAQNNQVPFPYQQPTHSTSPWLLANLFYIPVVYARTENIIMYTYGNELCVSPE